MLTNKPLTLYWPVTVATIVFIASCGRYPSTPGPTDVHHTGQLAEPGEPERTGNGYSPIFLAPGHKTQDFTFEIEERIVDIGDGYKYRALTYDGSFPAKTLVVEQGTLVRIKVTNNDKYPHSLHTHVIKYKPESDGSGVTGVGPGETRFFFWEVTDTTPVGFYPFHDHGGDGEGGQARGLIGMVSVVRPGDTANPGVGLLLHDIDPMFLFSTSGRTVGIGGGGGHGGHGGMSPRLGTTTPDGAHQRQSAPMHLVNGRFGSAPENTFEAPRGAKIRIGIVNLGTEPHTFHPHGNSFTDSSGALHDNVELLPGGFQTVELNAEALGTWLWHCHVPGHPQGGMWGHYVVR